MVDTLPDTARTGQAACKPPSTPVKECMVGWLLPSTHWFHIATCPRARILLCSVGVRRVTAPCPGAPDQESEGEEAAEARVALAQDMGRGNLASRNSRVRLQEVRFHLLGQTALQTLMPLKTLSSPTWASGNLAARSLASGEPLFDRRCKCHAIPKTARAWTLEVPFR